MPRQNLTTTPQWPAYSPVTPSTIYSKYPQGQLSGNLKVNPGKPSVYIFKGSNSFNEKTVSRIPRPAPPAFNAAASSDEKENTCSSQPFNFNLGASSPFDVNGALRPPSLTDFGFSASSTEKCKSRIPVSTASKTFVSTGDKENMSGPHLVAHTYGLSSPSHEKSNAKRPVPFTFGDSTSYTKNESAATSRIVPFTFTLAAPSDVKSNSKTTVCGTPTACTVNTRKTSTLPPVKFTFGASASPEEKGNSNRPAPYTFRGSASKEDNKNTSKMVPFTFTFSTPPVEKERTSMVPPFCFASKVPASSNQTRNLKLTLPAPLIFKTSTSPEPNI
ncbi:hypothetical protein K450DRAFT_259269 [Umbelopsis ramanniana AG]|uniref:Uncharacterized protein n=1 Tax=Umbelopsis ramanniana AG TaxID=1314678 RepID=A0AAD5E3D2_UMBRA|nr:uncharacterized protein K450DRAFT_259269 [Umbelopsis ramanniana AG]KAI8575979.1 hypothetical protein K450DRAFT_259269 [Umbelopsis ramanniana AG]